MAPKKKEDLVFPGQSTRNTWEHRYKGPYEIDRVSHAHKAEDFEHLRGTDLNAEQARARAELEELKARVVPRTEGLEDEPDRIDELAGWKSIVVDRIENAELKQLRQQRDIDQAENGTLRERLEKKEEDLKREEKLRKEEAKTYEDKVKKMEDLRESSDLDNRKALAYRMEKLKDTFDQRAVEMEATVKSASASVDQTALNSLSLRVSGLETALQSSENEQRQLAKKLSYKETEVADSDRRGKEERERLVAEHASTVADLQKQLKTVREEKTALEVKAQTDGELAAAECSNLQSEITELRHELEKSKEGQAVSRQEKELVQKEFDSQFRGQAKEHQRAQDKLQREVNQLQEDLRKSQRQNTIDKENHEKWNRSFMASLTRESGSAAEANEQKRKLQEENAKLLQNMQKEVDDARSGLKKAQEKAEECTVRADEADESLGGLRAENDSLTTRIGELDSQIFDLQARIQRRNTAASQAKQEIANLTAERGRLSKAAERLQNDLAKSHGERQWYIDGINWMSDQIDGLKASETRLRGQLDEAQEGFEQAEDEHNSEVVALQAKLDKKKALIKELKDAAEKLDLASVKTLQKVNTLCP